MELIVTDRNKLLNTHTQILAERRLAYAMKRFEHRIARIHLTVFDENGPKGGEDKVCRLMINLRGADDVIISDIGSDIAACLTRVAQRASYAVSNSIKKAVKHDRMRPRFFDSDVATVLEA